MTSSHLVLLRGRGHKQDRLSGHGMAIIRKRRTLKKYFGIPPDCLAIRQTRTGSHRRPPSLLAALAALSLSPSLDRVSEKGG